MEPKRPDLILVDKKTKSCVIIDVAVPDDCRIHEKEIEKIEKYQNLKRELKRLKVQTEAMICAAQEQPLRTNYTKNKTGKTSENPLCRMCGERGETLQHNM